MHVQHIDLNANLQVMTSKEWCEYNKTCMYKYLLRKVSPAHTHAHTHAYTFTNRYVQTHRER